MLEPNKTLSTQSLLKEFTEKKNLEASTFHFQESVTEDSLTVAELVERDSMEAASQPIVNSPFPILQAPFLFGK